MTKIWTIKQNVSTQGEMYSIRMTTFIGLTFKSITILVKDSKKVYFSLTYANQSIFAYHLITVGANEELCLNLQGNEKVEI